MKSKNITTIILEGVDGVGKDSVAHEMWQRHDKHFRVYVRGELSDYVYAQKYKRPFISTQRGLPFLYVLLVCKPMDLIYRISTRKYESAEEYRHELDKADDQSLFVDAAHEFSKDYHIVVLDTTYLTIQEAADKVWVLAQRYSEILTADEELNEYNKMYKRGCDKLGLKFYVRDNQPFIENNSIMADAQLHNGSYETFSDKTMPHNFIFSLGYNKFTEQTEKKFDFSYIIGSKIKVRPEVTTYLQKIRTAGLTCMMKETYPDKVFGDAYIDRLSLAKATVYCCRDLAYLKMITVRPYEAALSKQILFVDKESDPDCEILKQIHGDDDDLILKLYTEPDIIAVQYLSLTKDECTRILTNQRKWYINLKKQIGAQYNVDLH